MHPFVKALQEHFTAHQNPEKAEPMARYMKNHFLFRVFKHRKDANY